MKSKMIEVQSDAKLVKPNYAVALILISILILFVSGCITLGKDFPEANVSVSYTHLTLPTSDLV